jgi:hypothetical protein
MDFSKEYDLTPSPLYAYALCFTPPETLTLPTGIQGELAVITAGDLSAIAEFDVPIETLQADDRQLMAAVLHHDQVICQLFSQISLLPLRFGTCFTDPAAAASHLIAKGDTYRQRLQQLQNHGEYLLKATPMPITLPETDPDLKGRAYFLAKKQRLQDQTAAQVAQQQQLQTLWQQLEQHFRQTQAGTPQDSTERFYLLAHSDQATTLEAHLATWQVQAPQWQLTLDGPLPPYHFV